MNIHDAVWKADDIDGYITIPQYVGIFKVKPTNTKDGCILCRWNGATARIDWQPKASDLMNDEWLVIEPNGFITAESSEELMRKFIDKQSENHDDGVLEKFKAPFSERLPLRLLLLLFLVSFTASALFNFLFMRGQ